jgi:2-isopropylmalate synthase
LVRILDATLREGEQAEGVKFTKDQKVEIARALADFGVDVIEAGHPYVSSYDAECVKAVADCVEHLNLPVETLAHARAKKEDVAAVLTCGTQWVGIFMGINETSLTHRLQKTRDEAINRLVQTIAYAKGNGLKVRYTIEDATRTTIADIVEIGKLAREAGASILSLADTVGTATPEAYYGLVSEVKEKVGLDVEIHCHNDRGLALANSLAGFRAGASTIDASINGLGERCGITVLAELCLNLELYGNGGRKLKKLPLLSSMVEKYSGISVSPLSPIVGRNAFTHAAHLHAGAMMRDLHSYEPYPPDMIGRKHQIPHPSREQTAKNPQR